MAIPEGVESMMRTLPEGSCVIEITDGPNDDGNHTFFAYWFDASIGRTLRGQIFVSSVEDFQRRWVEHRPGAEAALLIAGVS